MAKMTKGKLIEAMKDYPDDTPIAVAVGTVPLNAESYAWLDGPNSCPLVWTVSERPDAIILEL